MIKILEFILYYYWLRFDIFRPHNFQINWEEFKILTATTVMVLHYRKFNHISDVHSVRFDQELEALRIHIRSQKGINGFTQRDVDKNLEIVDTLRQMYLDREYAQIYWDRRFTDPNAQSYYNYYHEKYVRAKKSLDRDIPIKGLIEGSNNLLPTNYDMPMIFELLLVSTEALSNIILIFLRIILYFLFNGNGKKNSFNINNIKNLNKIIIFTLFLILPLIKIILLITPFTSACGAERSEDFPYLKK